MMQLHNLLQVLYGTWYRRRRNAFDAGHHASPRTPTDRRRINAGGNAERLASSVRKRTDALDAVGQYDVAIWRYGLSPSKRRR